MIFYGLNCLKVYLKVGKPLVYAALNGYKGTLLTYGQTGTGKENEYFKLNTREIGRTALNLTSCVSLVGCTVFHKLLNN